METKEKINQVRDMASNMLSPFYLWIGFAILIYSIYLCFSKYGKVRLGDEKPEFSTFSWLVMIFCTGMGSNLLYWSAIEWIYYYQAPPMGVEPFSQKALELASAYGGFHWSFTGWAIYAIGAVTLGLRYYNKKLPGLTLSASCEKALGTKNVSGIKGRLIELVFLFGTIGGFTTMISFVIPMYCNNLSLLLGIENTFLFQVIMILFITLIFAASACKGLNGGIKKLSSLNIIVAVAMAIGILFAGPTGFIIKSWTNSMGYVFQNFIGMSLWTDPIANGGFPERWTSFYWAWWIALAPSMWIFTAKISKGRSIREIISGMIISGSAGCWLYFGVISNYGIYQQMTGKVDLVSILEQLGPESAVASLVLSLPLGEIWLLIWTITGIIFLITTMDSGAYTLAVSTTFGISHDEQPCKALRLFWSITIIVIPVGLMYAGVSMETLQAAAVLTAIPIGVLTIFTLISGYKYLRELQCQKNK